MSVHPPTLRPGAAWLRPSGVRAAPRRPALCFLGLDLRAWQGSSPSRLNRARVLGLKQGARPISLCAPCPSPGCRVGAPMGGGAGPRGPEACCAGGRGPSWGQDARVSSALIEPRLPEGRWLGTAGGRGSSQGQGRLRVWRSELAGALCSGQSTSLLPQWSPRGPPR